MIGRRAIVGLALLSAFLFCAFAAQSASAALTTSKNTTAFTCVKDATEKGDFKDAHCDETNVGKGIFKHELIPPDTTTEVDVTNEKVTESTTKSEITVLKTTITLVKTEIQCTVVNNNVKNSTIHNVEPEPKAHTFTGTVETEFSKCTVIKPANCRVKEPIVTRASVHGVEGLEGPKGEKNAMGLEFIGDFEEETLGEIEFENKGEEKCILAGHKAKIKGKLIGTNGPTTESQQENKESGATVVFTPKFKMQELKVGPEPAEFTSIVTAKMAGAGGNPITLTTTT
jgi:hypothetical protein